MLLHKSVSQIDKSNSEHKSPTFLKIWKEKYQQWKKMLKQGWIKIRIAWHFHARQFQNWRDWIDSFKISYVLQTVSEFVTVEDSFGTSLIWLVQISFANVARNIFTKLVLERYSNSSKNIEIRYLQRISKFPIDSFRILQNAC